jgi:RecB family exonuclease
MFARDGVLDLERIIVVLPGARAGRRLIELLVERAERDRLRLIPPATETPGSLPERLYESARPVAGDVARMLAWVFALQGTVPEVLAKVFPRRPEPSDFEGWCALARLCERLHRELAGDLLTFAAVATKGAELPDFNEADRWLALEAVRRLYVARLEELGLADRDEARIDAVRRHTCRTEKTIVLLATPDLNRIVRGMLEQITAQSADRISVWVFAPEISPERFDELGCTRVEEWRDETIDLRSDQVEIVERPSDQAAAVLRTIVSYAGKRSAAEITVGVPDEEVVPYIEQQFEQRELAAHHAAGLSVARTGPFRLFKVAADYLEHRRAADFASIVRHPDVELWLRSETNAVDCIQTFGEFSAEHLPASLRPDTFDSLPESDPLRRVHGKVEQWLAGLTGSRSLADWAEPLLEMLLTVYGTRTLDRNNAADRVVIQACDAMHGVLRQFHCLDPRARPVLDRAAALRLALRLAECTAIAPPPRRDAIELLGWLELPLDDAPALIVTGFNEGFVPDSINADAFLPNRLRHALGLLDNDRRYARDAYSLSAVLASRPDVKLIAGRRTADFEPLTPSRLLFACDDATIAQRIPLFFPEDMGQAASSVPSHSRRVGVSQFVVPKPAPLDRPIKSMSVTSFKDYLACPYRFYLRHVLRLKAIESLDELGPLGFGKLTHEVLCRFGSDSIKDSTDAESIRGYLNGQLDQLASELFGPDAVPAVRVQVEQLRRRLDAFARWQAKRRADGWRIDTVECEMSGALARFDVDGEAMFLSGRIDRIDRHERDGTWCVLDYKTSEDGEKPDRALGRDGRWHDLQLPLYRHLVRAAGIVGADESVQLGYIVLPRDAVGVQSLIADWTPDDLGGAEEAIRSVIRGVRAGKFDGPLSPPPRGFDEFAWICQEGRTAPSLDEEEEDEP